MGNSQRKIISDNKNNVADLINIVQESPKAIIYSDEQNYAKSEVFFHMVTDSDLNQAKKTFLDGGYRTTQTLQKRSNVEARIGTRVKRVVSGNTITLISSEIWLLPLKMECRNRRGKSLEDYFEGTNLVFDFSEGDISDFDYNSDINYNSDENGIPNPENLDQQNLEISKSQKMNTFLQKFASNVKIINMHASTHKIIDDFTEIFDNSIIEYLQKVDTNERDFIDSDDEDEDNDLLVLKRKFEKSYLSGMKETDELLSKVVAAVADLADLEENYKKMVFKFLSENLGKLKPQVAEDNVMTLKAEDLLQNGRFSQTGGISAIDLGQYTTQEFDQFLRDCLSSIFYKINITDGRGGIRLIPNSEELEKLSVKNKVNFEQISEVFKSYNATIYKTTNDILTVYPESIFVMESVIEKLNQQIEEDTVFNKSISRGKTDKKSYEIYQAVRITTANVEHCLKHANRVLNYVKKREQKIQVNLLMNQVM